MYEGTERKFTIEELSRELKSIIIRERTRDAPETQWELKEGRERRWNTAKSFSFIIHKLSWLNLLRTVMVEILNGAEMEIAKKLLHGLFCCE